MSANGVLSKDIKLGYKVGSASTYTDLPDLQEIPDLGGDVERIDITTLQDGNRRYMKGLQDFGDLTFTFLYDNSGESSSYRILRGLQDADTVADWEVALPDGTKFHFSGQVTTTISGAGVNEALHFTATVTLSSDMVVTNA